MCELKRGARGSSAWLLPAMLLLACLGTAQGRASAKAAEAYSTKWNINRPLNFTLSLFQHAQFERYLTDAASSKPALRILEIGCGEGRTLLELQQRFPKAELHCFNHPTYGRERGFGGANIGDSLELMKPVAQRWGIPLPQGSRLPAVKFGDAFMGEWPWADGFFDVIFSVHCLTKDPILLHSLAEAGRVLAVSGKAFLHTQVVNGFYGRMPRQRNGPGPAPECKAFDKPTPTTAGCGTLRPIAKSKSMSIEVLVQRWLPEKPPRNSRETAVGSYSYMGTTLLRKSGSTGGTCDAPHFLEGAEICLHAKPLAGALRAAAAAA
mmetsp:Transcript_40805/g.104431  ORF Transcript_40805/g.104431 Transcript_40805/m.104431 type:complete len:322 (-) Transcript_40805:99-1064(-)